ncbi:hypothetical protein FAP59_19145, partial [Morganella morganii]|nr:hypothetical protein [Morganella morganii]
MNDTANGTGKIQMKRNKQKTPKDTAPRLTCIGLALTSLLSGSAYAEITPLPVADPNHYARATKSIATDNQTMSAVYNAPQGDWVWIPRTKQEIITTVPTKEQLEAMYMDTLESYETPSPDDAASIAQLEREINLAKVQLEMTENVLNAAKAEGWAPPDERGAGANYRNYISLLKVAKDTVANVEAYVAKVKGKMGKVSIENVEITLIDENDDERTYIDTVNVIPRLDLKVRGQMDKMTADIRTIGQGLPELRMGLDHLNDAIQNYSNPGTSKLTSDSIVSGSPEVKTRNNTLVTKTGRTVEEMRGRVVTETAIIDVTPLETKYIGGGDNTVNMVRSTPITPSTGDVSGFGTDIPKVVAWGDENQLNVTNGTRQIAVGNRNTLTGNSIALGDGSSVTGGISLGNENSVSKDSVSIGNNTATGMGAVVIGDNADADTGNLAIGQNSSSTGVNSLALGKDSKSTADNEVSFGNSATGLLRKITNVADGTATTDVATINNATKLANNALEEARKYADSEVEKITQTTDNLRLVTGKIGDDVNDVRLAADTL